MSTEHIYDANEETDTYESVTEPPMFKVIMLNDHFTTMDFVVETLVNIFSKSITEATEIMMNIHKKGQGLCGLYSYDIATTKIQQVHNNARKAGFPLKCTLEAE